MRRRLLIPGGILVAMSLAFAPQAQAALQQTVEAPVEFSTTVSGSRTVAIGTAPDFPATTDVSGTTGTIVGTPALTTVTETLAQGANFDVKAQICEPDNYASPTTANCSVGHVNQFVNENGAVLPGSDISVDHTVPTVPVTVPFGTVSNQGSGANLGSQITLLSVSEVSTNPAYNGVYADSTNWTIHNLTTPGTWKGYWVVTLLY
jgi:hypothetical protein